MSGNDCSGFGDAGDIDVKNIMKSKLVPQGVVFALVNSFAMDSLEKARFVMGCA